MKKTYRLTQLMFAIALFACLVEIYILRYELNRTKQPVLSSSEIKQICQAVSLEAGARKEGYALVVRQVIASNTTLISIYSDSLTASMDSLVDKVRLDALAKLKPSEYEVSNGGLLENDRVSGVKYPSELKWSIRADYANFEWEILVIGFVDEHDDEGRTGSVLIIQNALE
jgi:hypothetical protein